MARTCISSAAMRFPLLPVNRRPPPSRTGGDLCSLMFCHLASGEDRSAPTRGPLGQNGEDSVRRLVDFLGGGPPRTMEGLDELGGVEVLLALRSPSLNSLVTLMRMRGSKAVVCYPSFPPFELGAGVGAGYGGSHGKLGKIAVAERKWEGRGTQGGGKEGL
ncbi:hypothetical protein V6N11_046890 [Hibiscus sabdariffa]|uniref:Uncharacterized protein n=1 Tax=Hibiscus sabdariffa TaxID=183260 RepID=A0ABR2NCP0_9ROSI